MGDRRRAVLAALAAVIWLAALPAGASAQLRFGARAGVNFATLTGDDIDPNEVQTRTGLVIGGFAEGLLSDIVGMEIGAQYSQKGFKSDLLGSNGAVHIDYIDVPVLLTVSVPAGETLAVQLYLGPSFSFRVKCTGRAFGFTASGCNGSTIKAFDLGADVGAGLRFGLGGGAAFLVDGFYDFSAASIDNSNTGTDVKNQVFSLTAGILMPAGD